MKRFPLLRTVLVSSLLLSTAPHHPTPFPTQRNLLHQELATLTERGLTYRIVDKSDCSTCGTGRWVEAIDPHTGLTHKFPLDPLLTPREPTHTGLPTLTIDLRTLDTNMYNWRFHYVNSMPLSEDWGFPLIVGDLDRNEQYEAYGLYQTQSQGNTRIYEQDVPTGWTFKLQYPPNTGLVDMREDIDRNGLFEVFTRYGDSLFVFEQVSVDSLPTAVKFRHRQWFQSASGIPNKSFDMNGDDTVEILYRGSRLDSTGQPNVEKNFIMQFDSSTNNLEEAWTSQLPPGCQSQTCTGAIAPGDFDGDGKAEFATSNFAGKVYVVEYAIGDSFGVTWSSDLSVAGRAAAGDVDGNGTTEFFIGGTQAELDGYVHLRAYVFERTGNNAFQPMFAFDIFPAGIFFVDLYQTADVDGDDVPELLLSFAGGVLIVKGKGEHKYEVFYYQPHTSLDGVATAKINDNGAAHVFISRHMGGQPVVKRTDVYFLDSSLVVGVPAENRLPSSAQLLQNYPNPFNPTTTFTFTLPHAAHVSLVMYDMLGRRIAGVVNGHRQAGNHMAVWDAANYPSGVYFARFAVMNKEGKQVFSMVNKLLLMK